MTFEDISGIVRGVPFISLHNARYLYDLIIRERLTSVLELGIAHGTATCYMAAALEEVGGSITSVDLLEVQSKFKPSPEEQLEKAGLSQFVTIVRTQTGYTWFLHDEIKAHIQDNLCVPKYDLCIIDGPKNWTIDGCAFFLVDKLLKNNGWIIFDDYNWTYASADAGRDITDGITHRLLSESERTTPHIREIFELLVKQHPHYSQFFRTANNEWAIARKVSSDQKVYSIVYRETFPSVLIGALIGIKRRAKQIIGD